MFIKQTDINKVVDKWISHPDEVKREDLKKPYLNTYFWVTKPKGKDDYVRVLGNFEIFMDLNFGQKSNSGKSKSPNQTVFIIKDLTTHEETKEGFIIDEYPNRRSRFGSVEKYEREKRDISKSSPENTPSSTKEIVKGSVLEFANSLCSENVQKVQKDALFHMTVTHPRLWNCANSTFWKDVRKKKNACTCTKASPANIFILVTGNCFS